MTEHPKWVDNLRPSDFAGFVRDRREPFVGREWLFAEIEAWRTGGDEPTLLVKGDPGVGKSAALAQLAETNPGGHVLAHHFCRADALETLRPGPFVRSLASVIARRSRAYAAKLEDPSLREVLDRSQCEADPAGAFEQGVLAPLETLPAPAGGACCILVDALDVALAAARVRDPGDDRGRAGEPAGSISVLCVLRPRTSAAASRPSSAGTSAECSAWPTAQTPNGSRAGL